MRATLAGVDSSCGHAYLEVTGLLRVLVVAWRAKLTPENALSRILVGIHFRHAVEDGVQHGRKIGRRAVDLFLKPLR